MHSEKQNEPMVSQPQNNQIASDRIKASEVNDNLVDRIHSTRTTDRRLQSEMMPLDTTTVQEIHKTEEAISTINSAITMTTKMIIDFTSDVSKENGVYNIRNLRIPDKLSAGAFQFYPNSHSNDNLLACIDMLRAFLWMGCSGEIHYSLTLLFGQSAWTIDNRIVRYKKFWRYLQDFDLELPDEMKVAESVYRKSNKVRYYATARLCKSTVERTAALIESCYAMFHLMLIPEDQHSERSPTFPWESEPPSVDIDLVEWCMKKNGLLFWRTSPLELGEYGFTGLAKTLDAENFIDNFINASHVDSKGIKINLCDSSDRPEVTRTLLIETETSER